MTDDILLRGCQTTVNDVRKLLLQDSEWIDRYAHYGPIILKNCDEIISHKSKFREWKPLHVYMTVGAAKSNTQFSLRYLGQDVAKLRVNKEFINISTIQHHKTNKRDFLCDIELDWADWKSKSASKFRKHFSNNPISSKASGKGNEEHRIESMLLGEFSKKAGVDKALWRIQPVKLAGIARFQMPTPLSASNVKEMKYAAANGGGIDILTRIGKATKLCVMEVKDENTPKEPPSKVIKQAVAYATFVRELLRSKSGNHWWKVFGFKGELPKSLNLYVACVMPSSSQNDYTFAGKHICIESDKLHLHHLYFKEANGIVTDIETSLRLCKINPAIAGKNC
ncbi:hypothetical protein [Geomonas propionica]|uniref:DUF91 domain-containing protein n=1 Tax=Geomonas propionica TaxID=2798582 RepID=A0ABS0YXW9_9BACT|nr:hypothetical protein [Geomonas propionica]MBJ6802761.1 hypothetical protein [Geomonas propionica]